MFQDPTFENCTCITGGSTAESGYCDNNCVMLVPYLLVSAVAIIISLSTQIPNVVVTLRYTDICGYYVIAISCMLL